MTAQQTPLANVPSAEATPIPTTAPQAEHLEIVHKRFLSDNPVAYKNAIEAAESYVSKLEKGDVSWLHYKPFDPTPGNPQYFRLMFDLLNILQAMQIPEGGRVLEIGSGPGWITEVLLMMGFTVEALEPSADLILIAKERCAGLHSHYRHAKTPKVTFHQTTLEEIEFDAESFDAILYFDVLHHIVDEEIAMEKSFRFLKPGGCVGVVEWAWHPSFREMEAGLIEEMAKFGTLENPFSVQYLDSLLSKAGFSFVQRYVGVNGFFTEHHLTQSVRSVSGYPMAGSNNLTARKPYPFPNCTDTNYKTNAILRLVSGHINAAERSAALVVECENTGETLLDNCSTHAGFVTFALRQGKPGSAEFKECIERHLLSEIVVPGQTVKMALLFTLPPGAALENWELDAVAEGLAWFSNLGIPSCSISCL